MNPDAKTLEQMYEEFTARSRTLDERARGVFPGADTRASAHYAPYPAFMARGEGARLYDVDGNAYTDFMNNFTSLIHGHGHPAVVRAVSEQIARGSAFAAPTESQIELGELLCERVPSLELLRFTSSGSEATLMAIRAARAFTGRPRVMKMEGGYHGSYDLAEVSLIPFPDRAGPLERPTSLAVDRSIAPSALEDAVVAPYNEPELATALIEAHADQLACVIVEPVLGSMGMIPGSFEFLHALRAATERHGVLLVLDEVITLRLSSGGAQAQLGLEPDLVSMGKIIGGGLPIGAFGGRRELLEQFDPARPDSVMHASTFSGNALSMCAGLAALRALERDDYDRLNALGDALRAGFDAAFQAADIRGQALGSGSLAQIVLADGELRSARDLLTALRGTGRIQQLLHLGMLRRGVFAAGRGMYCTSTPMSDEDVQGAVAALAETLAELRPVIEAETPRLLR